MIEKLPRAPPGVNLTAGVRELYNLFVGGGIARFKQLEMIQESTGTKTDVRGTLRTEEAGLRYTVSLVSDWEQGERVVLRLP